MKSTLISRKLLLTCLLLLSCNPLWAGDVGITYLKTIAQPSPHLPLLSGGGRLSVDEKGYLYAGTPGQGGSLHKISPDGRVIWRGEGHYSYTATAVDDQYIYGSGIGFYGYRHLLRRKKSSGVVVPGWRYVWKTPAEVVNGVRGFENPDALLVDDTFLYVLDVGNGELRRFHKETGEEQTFPNAIKVDGATDMAFAKSGELLVLSNTRAEGNAAVSAFVTAIDRQGGNVKNANLVSGLKRSAALAVHPQTGAIFIGEGGSLTEPVNKLRIFSSDGKDTGKTVGRGGEWQGKWSADSFNFASGTADIAFDPAGGFWANSFGHRMNWMGLLTHFNAAFQPDKVLTAATNSNIAVDEDLNVTVGGNYKLSWNGELLWTSGLSQTGAPNQFPTAPFHWTLRPIYADTQQAIFVNVHGPTIFTLNAQTGENAQKGFALPINGVVVDVARAGRTLYIMDAGKVYRTTTELAPLQEHFSIPEDVVKRGLTGLASDAGGSTLYISAGRGNEARLYAYRDGRELWQSKAGEALAFHKNIVLASNPTDAGVLTIDTTDGTMTGIFGQSAIGDRPALTAITDAVIGSKDGKDYIFIASQASILVYRIVTAQ